MLCNNKFCIYQNSGECFHKEVPHDESGVCSRKIYIKISDEQLKQFKKDSVDDLRYLAREEAKRRRGLNILSLDWLCWNIGNIDIWNLILFSKQLTILNKILAKSNNLCYNQRVRIQTRSESRETCSHIYL